ncbi:lipid IV(A) 3-deoxy-D-manno-octulosonic acid transferase [Thalassotalea piscium]|uniref:3-deoxy-D-manno-octulosonic acid transferase n=1 Tax=Thalassotalea piscium TaxID=1230533 RepID=A0A7X0NEP0_9GAMM|nr:lipid IV(A) 3-deoxy-D-manno-octulosonic acid transferase [Thalassotalea piscium]MBB6542030.1 3-deoxy-D-manno-octulosonic-acid transferase [Thalassotalea piscium]
MRNFITLLLYRLVLMSLLPLVIITLVIRSKNNPQYRKRLSERLGFVRSSFKQNSIVIHAASVGEVIALKPFVEKLLQQQPELVITFTTFTPTGSAQVSTLFGDRVQHCYLPLDIWPCTAMFLYKLKPKAAVFMETEIWPNLVAQCKHKDIKLLLINGRLSEKSVESYQKLTWLIQPSLLAFDHIYCQSQDNLARFLMIGATNTNISVSGNLKYDISINEKVASKQKELSQYLKENRRIWVVASTHQGDEDIILSAFRLIKAQHPDLLLILVPRHPERFDAVASLCKKCFNTIRRSEETPIKPDTDIWLLDSLGELLAVFALANVVTMGGSFSQIGGHNPLEPALFKLPIIVGPDMNNFTDIMYQLMEQQAVIQLSEEGNISEHLSAEMINLLNNSSLADKYGNSAHKVVLANQGASQRSLDKLLALIHKS